MGVCSRSSARIVALLVNPLLAAQALVLLALVLASYRYAQIVRRRRRARRQQRDREDVGLQGLVRVLGADQEQPTSGERT